MSSTQRLCSPSHSSKAAHGCVFSRRAASRSEFPARCCFVWPLAMPEVSDGLTAPIAMTYSAVQLFAERAAMCLGEFSLTDAHAPGVANICRRLDGIPLAIEMAAGRVD